MKINCELVHWLGFKPGISPSTPRDKVVFHVLMMKLCPPSRGSRAVSPVSDHRSS